MSAGSNGEKNQMSDKSEEFGYCEKQLILLQRKCKFNCLSSNVNTTEVLLHK